MNVAEHLNRSRIVLLFLALGVGLLLTAHAADEHGITIRSVRSGTAMLRQQGRLTLLEIKSHAGFLQRIPLSHPSDYRQGTNAPYETKLIAESPDQFLIFTDTFASNPGNVQGRCGASEERFVHVVALGAIPHETLSMLMDVAFSIWKQPHEALSGSRRLTPPVSSATSF